MTAESFDRRFEGFLTRARTLEEDGVPFPTTKIRNLVAHALATNNAPKAQATLDRAERLLRHTFEQWFHIRELVLRTEALRMAAAQLGLEPHALGPGSGSPREVLKAGPLSSALFESARSVAVTTTNLLENAIPAYGIAEARKLGETIQSAKRRGEEVKEAQAAFAALLKSIKGRHTVELAKHLAQARQAVAKIPSAPAVAVPGTDEEEEILLEARILARRIHRIKRNARDAQSAARLMTHVRAALSEDRRYGTPQEEIEELWDEVSRLTMEHEAADAPALPPARKPPASDPGRPSVPADPGRRNRFPPPAIPTPEPLGEVAASTGPSRRRTAVETRKYLP